MWEFSFWSDEIKEEVLIYGYTLKDALARNANWFNPANNNFCYCGCYYAD